MIQEWLNNVLKKLEESLDEEIKERIEQIAKREKNDFGVDPLGCNPLSIKSCAPFLIWLYKNYFRVETFGAHNIPKDRCMVIANHSGQLPFDAAMIETAFILEGKNPRLLRGMTEKWVAEIPFISTFFARIGQVVGTPSTCKFLLEKEEGVIVFPEGVKGISKLFSERYKLANFGTGFMRIALAAKAPIIPVALIGAEEQAPAIANFTSLAKNLGMPALPLIFPQIIPLPMPVKYRIYIGKPMNFVGDGTEDSKEIKLMVDDVKLCIQNMLDEGLRKREHIFF